MIREFFSKVFTDFWNLKFWIIWLPITCLIFVLTYFLWSVYDDARTKRQQDSLSGSAQQIIQTDAERRRAESEKSDDKIVMTPPRPPADSTSKSAVHPHTHTKSTHVTEPMNNESDVPSRELLSGLYKGMTPEEAQERIEKKHALDQRWKAYLDKSETFTDAALKRADDQLSMMLSVFKSMSPEQLEQARVEVSKTLPAEEVDTFFDEVANEGITKTLEEIGRDAQQILFSREAHEIVRRELANEWNEIQQGYRDFYGADVYESMQQETASRIERRLASENPDLLEAIRRAKQ